MQDAEGMSCVPDTLLSRQEIPAICCDSERLNLYCENILKVIKGGGIKTLSFLMWSNVYAT